MRQQVGDNYIENVSEVSPIETTYDATLNDSNKSFVVPGGEMWKLNWAKMILVSSATVGNRLAELIVLDASGNNVFSVKAGAIQGAGVTRTYHFVQHVSHEAAFVQSELLVPIPPDLYLPAGFTLQLLDSATIDAAADDMTVSFQAKVYKGL